METPRTTLVTLALLGLLAIVGGCRQPHEGWEPPVEETSTRLLQQEADEALRLIDAAREDLAASEGRATEQLSKASQALQRLTLYYLPLLEARERVYNAHRYVYFGESVRAEAELETVEQILDRVVERGGPPLLKVLTPALDLCGEARAAIPGAPDQAPRLLKELATNLNLASLKGDLELNWDRALEEQATGS